MQNGNLFQYSVKLLITVQKRSGVRCHYLCPAPRRSHSLAQGVHPTLIGYLRTDRMRTRRQPSYYAESPQFLNTSELQRLLELHCHYAGYCYRQRHIANYYCGQRHHASFAGCFRRVTRLRSSTAKRRPWTRACFHSHAVVTLVTSPSYVNGNQMSHSFDNSTILIFV